MKRLSIETAALAALAALSACGGGSDDLAPLAQCNGAPKAAVIYVGPGVPVELASLPSACVYTTEYPSALPALVTRAKSDSGLLRVYMIANGNAAPLDLMVAHPGIANIVSLWSPPAWSGDMGGALATVYSHGPNRPVTTNHDGPVVWDAAAQPFDVNMAIEDLNLQLAN